MTTKFQNNANENQTTGKNEVSSRFLNYDCLLNIKKILSFGKLLNGPV